MGVSALNFIPVGFHDAIANRTSNQDVTTYLQEWLDYCSVNLKKGYLPAGLYKVSGPLWVTRTKQPSGFYTNNIEGDGGGYTLTESQSTIQTSDLENPCLIIQRGRGVTLSKIQITGANTATPNFPSFDGSDYQSPGVRTNQFSPNCGIAIDPTLGSIPVEANRYPALIDDYLGDTGGCKNILISEMSVRDFLVGVMVSPNTSLQAEMVVVERSHIGGHEYGLSYGQPQSRMAIIENCDIEFCRVAVTGRDHGQVTGSIQKIDGCQFVHIAIGFRFEPNKSAVMVDNSYFEVLRLICEFGQGFGQIKAPFSMSNCDFNFVRNFNTAYIDPIIAKTSSPISMFNCWFNDNSLSFLTFNLVATHNFAHYDLYGCQFWGGWQNNPDAVIGVQRNNPIVSPQNGLCNFRTNWTMCNDDIEFYRIPESTAEFEHIFVTLTGTHSLVDEVLSFTAFNQTQADKLSIGQLLLWQIQSLAIPALIVETINGLDFTARTLFNPDEYEDPSGWLQPNQIEAVGNPRTAI